MQKRDFSGVTSRNPVRAVHDARYAGNVTIQRGVSPGVHRNRAESNRQLGTHELSKQVPVSSGILVAANRFPFSSTPTGSPTQGNNSFLAKDLNSSSNKATLSGSSVKENFKIPNLKGVKMNPAVTKSKVDFGSSNLSEPISPIRAIGRNREVMLTKERGVVDREREDESLLISSNHAHPHSSSMVSYQLSSTWICEKNQAQTIAATKVPFPFPGIDSFDSLDREKIMVDKLRMLSMYRTVKVGVEKLTQKEKCGNTSAKGLKKKKSENTSPSFIFSKGMFSAPNTTAFIHVYHLLFECYNPHECEIAFRDAWPAFDKKLESAFRRAALNMLKNMIQAHPQHFCHVKPETLVGLINKPGGDRFIQLTECVMELVLTKVVSDLGGSTQNIVEKPKCSKDPELVNRQILYLKKATQCVSSRMFALVERMHLNDYSINKKIRMLSNREAAWISYKDGLELSAEDLLSEVQEQMVGSHIELDNEIESSWFTDLASLLSKANAEVLDMNIGIEKLLLNSANDCSQTITNLEIVLRDLQRLKFILAMDRSKRNIIDGKKLRLLEESKPATLANFYNSVTSIVDDVLGNSYLNGPTKEDVLKQFKTIDLKFQYLKLVEQEMKKSSNLDIDLRSLRQYLDSSVNDLQTKLKRTDWSSYSKVYDEKLTSLLGGNCLLSQVDLQRQTGLTPGINKFLSVKARENSPDVIDGKELVSQNASNLTHRAMFNTEGHNLSNNQIQISRTNTSDLLSSQTSQYYVESGTPNTSRDKRKPKKQRVSFVDKLKPPPQDSPEAIAYSDDRTTNQPTPTETRFSLMSPEPTVISTSAQARLSHIMSILREDSPRSFSDSRRSVHELTMDGNNSSRRKSARFSSRLSITSDTNISLLEDWSYEKELMGMDCPRLHESSSDEM